MRGQGPINIAFKDLDRQGDPVPGAEHVMPSHPRRAAGPAERSPRVRPRRSGRSGSWTTGAASWSATFKGSWARFDAARRVGQCSAHIIRHLQGVWDLHPSGRPGPSRSADLREAGTAVADAKADGRTHLDLTCSQTCTTATTEAVTWESSPADTATGKTTRTTPAMSWPADCRDKATDQIWLWTINFAVPWTSNRRTRTREPKLHQKVSGYWHTPGHRRALLPGRSYLISARNHGVRPIDAIHRFSPEPPGHHRQRPDHGFT